MGIMKEWPEWAWVSRHAENSRNDHLVISGSASDHSFPHLGPVHYCNRSWGPQEYIEYRLKMLKEMAEDVQKLVQLFEEKDVAVDQEQPRVEAVLEQCKLLGSSI